MRKRQFHADANLYRMCNTKVQLSAETYSRFVDRGIRLDIKLEMRRVKYEKTI